MKLVVAEEACLSIWFETANNWARCKSIIGEIRFPSGLLKVAVIVVDSAPLKCVASFESVAIKCGISNILFFWLVNTTLGVVAYWVSVPAQDFEVVNEPEYFIGNIVAVEGEPLKIIDGQQRLTTLFLLLSAIRDCYLDIDPEKKDDIQRIEQRVNEVNGYLSWTDLEPVPSINYKKIRYKVWKAKINEKNGLPGTILDNDFIIGCRDKSLEIIEIQKEGKKKLQLKSFLTGINFKQGDLLK